MTIEESWRLKPGDTVKILSGSYKGMYGTIPWIDRIYDDEAIPVQIDGIHKGQWYSQFKYQDLELI
mgnify:CR=1 FL=1